MPDINVSRAFIVTMPGGERIPLVPGMNSVTDEVAAQPVIQYLLVPKDTPVIDTGDPMIQPDANGIGQLVQARAAAEDAATRLRSEVQRLTLVWSDAEVRARRAESLLEDAQSQIRAQSEGTVAAATFDDMVAQRDAAHARIAELEGSVGYATSKVSGLAQEFQAQPSPVPASPAIETPSSPPAEAAPAAQIEAGQAVSERNSDALGQLAAEDTSNEGEADEPVGDYTVRRRGKKYTVVKLDVDGNTLETLGTYDDKSSAESEAESLRAKL